MARCSIEQYGPDIQNFICAGSYVESMSSTSHPYRGLACAFALCALAIFALLSGHPSGGGHTVAEVLQVEARDRVRDGVVHGGFIVTSAILLVCLAGLSRILGWTKVSVTIGFVAFCSGAGALMMSMTLDGLVVPAIATRYLSEGTTQALASAQTLLLFCGTCIKVLMPMGQSFEGAGMLGYSVAMIARRWFWPGGFGVAAGIVMLSGPLLLSRLGPHLVIGGFVILCVWYLGVAGMLYRDGRGWIVAPIAKSNPRS